MLYKGVVNNGLSPLYSKKVILILSNIIADIPILLYAKKIEKSIDTFFFYQNNLLHLKDANKRSIFKKNPKMSNLIKLTTFQ